MDNLLYKAQSHYEKITNHYQKMLDNAKLLEEELSCVKSIPMQDGFYFEVFGRIVQLKLSLVIHNEYEPFGQITSFLIKNHNNSLRSEEFILPFWVDSRGVIYEDLSERKELSHATNNQALVLIAEFIIEKLIYSDEFLPISDAE